MKQRKPNKEDCTMEYHFTGTGDSLDVTFIADGIIDGSGSKLYIVRSYQL